MRNIIFIFLAFLIFQINDVWAVNISYKYYKLDNDLEIYVVTNNRAEAVTHMLVYKVGSVDEPLGKSGIAHFFEHAMFKGTEKYPGNSYPKIVGSIGGNFNAFTSDDLTAYYVNSPADKLEIIMDLESDRLQNLNFNEQELMHERDVVMEERRMRVDNYPYLQLREQQIAALFMNTQYHITTIGWMHEIASINVDDLKQFYNKFYAPNNAILIVTGDVKPEEVYKLAEKYYGGIPKKEIPERMILQEPPRVAKTDLIMYSDKSNLDYWFKSYLASSFNHEKENIYALDLLSYILGGSDNSVLYNELVLDEKLSTSVSASYNGLMLGQSTFDFTIIPQKEKISEIKDQDISNIIQKLKKQGITDKQLIAAKNNIKKNFELMADGYYNIAYILARFLSVGGKVEDINNYSKNLEKVTKQDIYNAIDKLFVENNSVTAKLVKTSK